MLTAFVQRLALAAVMLVLAAIPTVGVLAQDTVVIPFEPQLEEPYRYELTSWKGTLEQRKSEVTLIQELSFRERDGGYSVTISIVEAFVGPDKKPMPEVGPLVDLFGDVVLDLDTDGYPVRVANWDEVKKRIEDAIPFLARTAEPDPNKRPQAERFFRQTLAQYTSLPAEDAVFAAVKHWPEILGGGDELKVGEIYTGTVEQANALTGESIEMALRFTLTIDERTGNYRLAQVTSLPSEDVIKNVEALLGNIAKGTDFADKKFSAELTNMGDLTQTMLIDHNPESGMIEYAELDRVISGNGEFARIRLLSE